MKGITCCGDCGYYNWKKHKCNRAMNEGDAKDGFYADCPLPDVVIEQQPRVMTLEEVRNAHKTPMWFESKGTFRGEKCFWCLNLGVSPSFRVHLMPAIGEQSTELSLAVYREVWRCWTSRPTDAQMEAEPWKS